MACALATHSFPVIVMLSRTYREVWRSVTSIPSRHQAFPAAGLAALSCACLLVEFKSCLHPRPLALFASPIPSQQVAQSPWLGNT